MEFLSLFVHPEHVSSGAAAEASARGALANGAGPFVLPVGMLPALHSPTAAVNSLYQAAVLSEGVGTDDGYGWLADCRRGEIFF